jgi:multidrug resistance efflux pump
MTQPRARRPDQAVTPVNIKPVEAPAAEALPSAPRPRYALRNFVLPAVLVSLLPVLAFGLLYVWDQTGYVSTDSAVVSGTVAQLGSAFAGQLRDLAVDVGDDVSRDRVMATVQGTTGQTFRIRAPFDGVVVARYANLGDVLTAGRPILAVLNPAEVWVEVQIDETQISRILPGQPADVTVDALGQTVPGRVLAIGSASTSSLGAQAVTRDAGSRSRQFFPVRIAVDQQRLNLVYGGLAAVKIHVR